MATFEQTSLEDGTLVAIAYENGFMFIRKLEEELVKSYGVVGFYTGFKLMEWADLSVSEKDGFIYKDRYGTNLYKTLPTL